MNENQKIKRDSVDHEKSPSMGHNTDSRYTLQCHPTGQRNVLIISRGGM